ncbi:MAG: hypothetical protein ACRD9R_21190 [Pyrinomonadaceae bacterium]
MEALSPTLKRRAQFNRMTGKFDRPPRSPSRSWRHQRYRKRLLA